MQPQQQSFRANFPDLTSLIEKKIGAEKSKKYLFCLQRFLSLKLSKTEFDKSCFRLLGRENLPLHNQLIRSLLKNACHGKASNGPLPPLRKCRSRGHRGSLVAPLGIPFCSAGAGGARKVIPSGNFPTSYDICCLTDSGTLKKRMEEIAAVENLRGVTMECANLLNKVVDVYLKRIINSCVELVRARSDHPRRQSTRREISMHDLKVAMEMNPRQLGEDWPLLLEKICMQSYEL